MSMDGGIENATRKSQLEDLVFYCRRMEVKVPDVLDVIKSLDEHEDY